MDLSHVNPDGKAHMVDVSGKPDQVRTAVAEGYIKLESGTLKRIKENTLKKGDVLSTARIAGIQAAKLTAMLIPLCHPLQLSKVNVDLVPNESGIMATAMVRCVGKTGVEMEALTAVQISLLTIYDMCKAVDNKMAITNIQLIEKTKE